ncbi:MAG: hypothetical protein C4521_03370 [Actinobacteria bacterium]|nr:MAG: hypothetical protein C4521_03370 [Actinomycetota bacterium]
MLYPWTSRARLERLKAGLEEELDRLRGEYSEEKRKVKGMEKELYWGKVSLEEMKRERKLFLRIQRRIHRLERRLAAVERRLGGG